MSEQLNVRPRNLARWSARAAFVLALVALSACSSSGGGDGTATDSITTIKYAYPAPVPSLLPVYVANDNPSICASFGIRIKAVAVNPAAAIAAVASNSVQMSEDPATTLLPAAAKSPTTIQATAFTGPESEALWAVNDVNSISDLRGKTVAATAQGATSDIYLRTLFSQAGMEPGKDIKIVYTNSGPAMLAQAVSGHASAFPYPPPVPDAASKVGFHQLAAGNPDPGTPTSLILSHAIAVNPGYAAAHPDVVTNALRCINASVRFITTHQEERDAALVKYAGLDESAAEGAYNANKATFQDGLKAPSVDTANRIIDTLVGTGIFTRDQFSTPTEKIVDAAYLK